jgi:hypothetical protein
MESLYLLRLLASSSNIDPDVRQVARFNLQSSIRGAFFSAKRSIPEIVSSGLVWHVLPGM